MTAAEVQQLITTLWTRQGSNRVSSQDLRDVAEALLDLIQENDLSGSIDEWDALVTYDTVVLKYAESNARIWKSKVDNNLGNEPPQDPGVSENTWWIEISKASNLGDWTPGLYGEGLIIMSYNNQFVKLVNPVRPFESVNIETEIADGDWLYIPELLVHPPQPAVFTLGPSGFYPLTGAGSNVNMPPRNGQYYKLKNKSSGDKVLIRDGTDQFYTWKVENSVKLIPGQVMEIIDDGTHWSTS